MRYSLFMVVGLLIGGSAIADAAEQTVLLHCSGSIMDERERHYGMSENLRMNKNGDWIIWDGIKIKRLKIWPSAWEYKLVLKYKKEIHTILFDPFQLSLLWSTNKETKHLNCFPITNPFKK